MTTLSYREIVKKIHVPINSQTSGANLQNAGNGAKSAKKRISATNIISLIDPEDSNLLKRNI